MAKKAARRFLKNFPFGGILCEALIFLLLLFYACGFFCQSGDII